MIFKEKYTAQENKLLQILRRNRSIQLILERAKDLNVPNWYLGAGGIPQTAWNIKHGFDVEHGIKDYDLVYYDAKDTSYEAEDVVIQKGKILFNDIPVLVEIRNQARVHLWYKNHFGKEIAPYKSVEEAIDSWPATSTAVGLRKIGNKFQVLAPFGLDDILNMTVRANKIQITREIYQNKVDRWTKVWPKLKVVPW